MAKTQQQTQEDLKNAKDEELLLAKLALNEGLCDSFEQTTPEQDQKLGYDILFEGLDPKWQAFRSMVSDLQQSTRVDFYTPSNEASEEDYDSWYTRCFGSEHIFIEISGGREGGKLNKPGKLMAYQDGPPDWWLCQYMLPLRDNQKWGWRFAYPRDLLRYVLGTWLIFGDEAMDELLGNNWMLAINPEPDANSWHVGLKVSREALDKLLVQFLTAWQDGHPRHPRGVKRFERFEEHDFSSCHEKIVEEIDLQSKNRDVETAAKYVFESKMEKVRKSFENIDYLRPGDVLEVTYVDPMKGIETKVVEICMGKNADGSWLFQSTDNDTFYSCPELDEDQLRPEDPYYTPERHARGVARAQRQFEHARLDFKRDFFQRQASYSRRKVISRDAPLPVLMPGEALADDRKL